MDYKDNFNLQIWDVSGSYISGLDDGLVSVSGGLFVNTIIGDNLGYSGTTLSVNPNPIFDSVNVGNTGVSSSVVDITTGVSGVSSIYFSDTIAGRGKITYDHNVDGMNFVVGGSNRISIVSTNMTVSCNVIPSGLRNIGEVGNEWQKVYTNQLYCSTYAELGEVLFSGVLLCDTNNLYDIGDSANRFKNLYCYSVDALDSVNSVNGVFTNVNSVNGVFSGYINADLISCNNIGCVSVDVSDGYYIGGNLILSSTSLGSSVITSSLQSIGTQINGLNIANATTYKINNVVVLSNNSLGSGVIGSSLEILGTLSGGLNIATGQTYRINGVAILSSTSLASSVVNSSLTSLGTLSGGLNIATGQTYKINSVAILSATVLGSSVITSSLQSIGTQTGGLNIAVSQTYKINGVAILSATVLGSSVINSSLQSVGVLSSLSVSGIISPNANNTIGLGTPSLYWLNAYITTLNAVNIAGALTTSSQTNITSIGTLVSTLNCRDINPSAGLTYSIGVGLPFLNVVSDNLYGLSLVECRGNLSTNNLYAYTGTAINCLGVSTTATFNIGGVSHTSTVLDLKSSSGTANSAIIKFTDSVGTSGSLGYNHVNDTMTLTAGGVGAITYQTGVDDILYVNGGDKIQQRWYRPTTTTGSIVRWYSDNGGVNSIQVRIGGTGAIYAQNTTLQTISDRRRKENISYTKMEGCVNKWIEISEKLCVFNWKGGNKDIQYGLIAQDMEEIDKKYVLNDKNNGEIDGEAVKCLNGDLLHHIMRSAVGENCIKTKKVDERLERLITLLKGVVGLSGVLNGL